MSRELPEHGTVSDEGDQPPYLEKKMCVKIYHLYFYVDPTYFWSNATGQPCINGYSQFEKGSWLSKDIWAIKVRCNQVERVRLCLRSRNAELVAPCLFPRKVHGQLTTEPERETERESPTCWERRSASSSRGEEKKPQRASDRRSSRSTEPELGRGWNEEKRKVRASSAGRWGAPEKSVGGNVGNISISVDG